MRYEIAHSVRGRLRLRYPVTWLKTRRDAIESRLRTVSGVRAVAGSSLTGSVRVDYDPFHLAEGALIDELHTITASLARTPVHRRHAGPKVRLQRAPLLSLIGASGVLAAACFPPSGAVGAGLVLASSVPSLLRAGSAVRRRRLDGDVLEAATLVLLAARGNYVASALLTWLRTAGEYIVANTAVTTRRSLYELVTPSDQTVTLREGSQRRAVRVGALSVGDVVVVAGPDRPLAVDGTVVGGEALVNQQTVTGEALPVERRPGDPVFAATTVEHGEIEVRVDHVGLDTAVGRIVHAIEAAAAEKSDIQLFAERLADREVGRTFVLAGMGAAFSRSLDAGTAILVADYGLAARIGIPTAILASIRHASGLGILIKGPRTLENLARVDTVVFDKTGTLTSGTPRVSRIVTYMASMTQHDLLRLTAAAEQGFRHPVARAVARLAAERRLHIPIPASPVESVGLGVDVRIEGLHVLVGSRRFMQSREILLGVAGADEAAAHGVGASPTFVAIDGRLAGMLVLQDELRAEAATAVRALRARRMRNVIMLSGDHAEPSRVIAESLGLRHHYADLLPEDKARLIRELKDEGRVVAMVGDGVNDALALSEAHVGVTVPGGAPVATEVADVVLLRGGLDLVVGALDLAGLSIDGVQRVLRIASYANLAVVGLASFGLAQPTSSILISHGATVAAAMAAARRSELRQLAETTHE
jgi:heavy metal translocating P-type ATPase